MTLPRGCTPEEYLLEWCAAFRERGIKPTGDDGLFLCDRYLELAEENARLREAVEVSVEWFDAEDNSTGTFYDRVALSQRSDYLCRKALGLRVAEL